MIVLALAVFPLALRAAPAPISAPEPDRIREAVRGLGRTSEDEYSTLKFLATEPRHAVAALIDELAVVRRPPQVFHRGLLDGDGRRGKEVGHDIWCVRGLGYLTGLTFVAPSHHWFTRREDWRRSVLLREVRNGDEPPGRAIRKSFPYFATIMSTDATAIAPEDAQRAIIAQWRAWHAAHGATHRYEPDESWEWYFGGLPADVP